MMVECMRDRNYLAANDVYLKLAIGNAAWPIGVTSVGIHERSAREKISHVGNASGKAHIMNDEVTRKWVGGGRWRGWGLENWLSCGFCHRPAAHYCRLLPTQLTQPPTSTPSTPKQKPDRYFQAIKRLMSNMQRLYPTDPSRSIDFNLTGGEGRGAAGGGSQKMALLEAEKKGDDWRNLGLPAAPHHMARDGSVAIPRKWDNVLRENTEKLGLGGGGGEERGE
jgi:pre-mRNA-splicing factor 18